MRMSNASPARDLAEEQKLIEMAQNGDESALTALLERYKPLVVSASHRFSVAMNSPFTREELVQSGYVGLLTAIGRYDKEKDTLLGTYALAWILGEMKRAIKNSFNRMGEYDLAERVKRMQNQFEMQHGRSPALEEISNVCNIPLWQIAYLLNACDAAPYEADTSGRSKPNGIFCEASDMEQITEFSLALDALTKEEHQIILLRYYRGCTQSETARLIGKSQAQVSRLERSALDRLKQMLS